MPWMTAASPDLITQWYPVNILESFVTYLIVTPQFDVHVARGARADQQEKMTWCGNP